MRRTKAVARFRFIPRMAKLLSQSAARGVIHTVPGFDPGAVWAGPSVSVFGEYPSRLDGDHDGKECPVGQLQRLLNHADFPLVIVENNRQNRGADQLS